jgi:peptidoglycan/LPS O-acetylase OafA/YrhL
VSAKDKKLPSLDGLRAISIALVILGHLSGTKGFGTLDLGIGNYAHLGVVVFFVISGFLISSLLISEHEKNGRISLRLFYLRRALRIFPASYFYMGSVLALWLAGLTYMNAGDAWHSISYTVNYMPRPSWIIGHLWSLSVEEQFYLIWPFAFLVAGPRKAIWVVMAMLLLGPASRSAAWLFLRGTPFGDTAMFPVVADSLAVGCFLALTRDWLESQGWYLQIFRPVVSVFVLLSILILNRFMPYTVVSVAGMSLINVGIAILVHRSVCRPDDWVGRILNLKAVAFVGVLSYSLYLWQQPFLNRESGAWINLFPQNLAGAILAALGSYLLLEKPLLRLRHRLHQ